MSSMINTNSSASDTKDSIEAARAIIAELDNPSGRGFAYDQTNFPPITKTNLSLFRIDKITFEEDAPRQEALENVLATMCIPGINFVYIIEGNKGKVNFYFGVAKDFSALKPTYIPVKEIGKYILLPSLTGNFRGSQISEIPDEKLISLIEMINNAPEAQILEGVPGLNQKDDKKVFQGIDRLVDVMADNLFRLVIIAKPIVDTDVQMEIYSKLCKVYSLLSPIVKINRQKGKSEGHQVTHGTNHSDSTSESHNTSSQNGTNHSETSSNNKSQTKTNTKGTNENTNQAAQMNADGDTTSSSSRGKGTTDSHSDAICKGESNSSTDGTSHSNTQSIGKTTQKTDGYSDSSSDNTGKSSSDSFELSDKSAKEWMKYLDDILFPRFDYGKGKGLFVAATALFANLNVLTKLRNTIRSVFSGEVGNRVPFNVIQEDNEVLRKAFQNFQLPFCKTTPSLSTEAFFASFARSKCFMSVKCGTKGEKRLQGGCWMSARELGIMAGIPQREVVGLKLTEEVEFGLNVEEVNDTSQAIVLGKLVQSGQIRTNVDVNLQMEYLDKHIFVAGVTGSGKTTTCKRLLLESKLPFMVIEPAKTEYRSLLNSHCPDLLVFTLGEETTAPFRLNPFEFLPGENITSRVDMIKATIEAAFDMEAAIPQIIEAAIYDCYKDKGWDIDSNKNTRYEDPFADGVFAFPTLEEMIEKCDEVVVRMNFDKRLKDDYIGSIKARLNGLLLGAKGAMLNCRRSLDFEELLDKKIVLEMEEIRSGSEKSLIMGFILTNHFMAIKHRFDSKGKHPHITLIEEAHRLLSKYEPGDSLNKKHGVETFADMLAEIRKYGESLIIVDQIPNKMTPEVLKNTNTKIVHRLFAQDDKETVGATMSLSEDQCRFLSSLAIGRAIVFNGSWDKAIQVQINPLDKEDESSLDKNKLHKIVMKIYAHKYKRGILDCTEFLCYEPTVNELESFLKAVNELSSEFSYIWDKTQTPPLPEKIPKLLHLREKTDTDTYQLDCLIRRYFKNAEIDLEEKRRIALSMIDDIAAGNTENFKDRRQMFSSK